MADWFAEHAPSAATPAPVVAAGGDWFAQNAPPAPKEEPGILAKAGNFVTDTLSKTAHNMDLTHVLDTVKHAENLAQEGKILSGGPDDKEESAMSTLKTLIPDPLAIAKDVWGKIHSGDISGASAAILPLLMLKGGPEAAEGAGGLVSDAAAATRKTMSESPLVAGAKAAAPEIIKNLPVVGKPITAAAKAFQAAKTGLEEATAQRVAAAKQAAIDTAVAEQRANGRSSLADATGIIVAPRQPIPELEPIQPAPRAPRTVAPPPARRSLADIAGIQVQPRTPIPEVQPIRQAPRAAATPAPEAQAAPSAAPSAEVLEGVSQWATKKPFAKLSAKDQISVRAIAAKLGNPQDTLGAIAGETVAPVVPEIKVAPAAAAKPIDTGILSYPGHTKGFDMSEWTPEEARQFSPQEAQSRQSIAIKLAPALLKAGIKAEDLGTETGRARAAEIASAIPSLSKNKALMNSLKNYDPSDLTLDAAQTLMSQWDKFAGMLGFKNLADIAKK